MYFSPYIIDILLTLLEDDELSKYILVSGSIVPYLILSKESKDKHEDLYIYVLEEKMNFLRKRLNELSKEYLFDIISDSKWYSKQELERLSRLREEQVQQQVI